MLVVDGRNSSTLENEVLMILVICFLQDNALRVPGSFTYEAFG